MNGVAEIYELDDDTKNQNMQYGFIRAETIGLHAYL